MDLRPFWLKRPRSSQGPMLTKLVVTSSQTFRIRCPPNGARCQLVTRAVRVERTGRDRGPCIPSVHVEHLEMNPGRRIDRPPLFRAGAATASGAPPGILGAGAYGTRDFKPFLPRMKDNLADAVRS